MNLKQAPTDGPHATSSNLADDTVRNLFAGVRLVFGRSIESTAFRLSVGQFAFAIVALWLAVLLGEKLVAGADSEFWIWGVTAFAARMYAWLCVIGALSWLAGGGRAVVAVPVALIYTAAPIALFSALTINIAHSLGIEPGDAYQGVFADAVLLWYGLSFWRVFAVLIDPRWLRATGASVLYVIALIVIEVSLPAPAMFYGREPGVEALDVESIYYRQQHLVDRQLRALAAQDPDTVDVYFVTIGAFSGQDVFMHEVLATRAIAEQQLGLKDHTVALLNNRRTIDDLPLANLPNLKRVVDGLAEIMDRDADIAFLYLTSHGSDDGSLSTEFAELAPNDLSAHDIRQALDDAGILWRVVIVSACYSGSFVEPLRSPKTLVITAAAPDRASFGCSHEHVWTYFGRAYFAEALSTTTDLVDAFEVARKAVEKRERDDGLDASKPQIALGRQIEEHLTRWRRPAAAR